jgi:hypothetical protein
MRVVAAVAYIGGHLLDMPLLAYGRAGACLHLGLGF